jgi:hypothetical protein
MTIPTTTIRHDYVGNGSNDTFPYTFKIFEDTDLKVYVDGVLQTLTTHYTVTGAGTESGGNVEMVTPPGNGLAVAVLADVDFTQTTDLVNETGFYQDRIEDALDKGVRQAQVLEELATRTLRLPEDEAGTSTKTTLPSLDDRKGRNLSFDATTGQPVASTPASAAVSAAMEPVVGAATLPVACAAMGVNRQLVLSVKDSPYNAVGDGAADDTAAIQTAINAIAATGGVVYFPIGTYRITAALTWVGKNALRLTGARSGQDSSNKATRILCDTVGIVMLDGRDALHVHIDGLLLDGNAKAQYGIRLGIAATHDQHVIIEDVAINTVTNGSGVALSLSNSAIGTGSVSDSTFRNLQISGCKIGVDNYAQNNNFYDCVVAGCTTGGIVVRSFSQSNWYGGIFSGNAYDVLLETAAQAQSQNFSGVWFETSTNGIVGAIGGSCFAPFLFAGCPSLSTASTAQLMDFTAINGPVTIVGGLNYPVGGSSSTIKTNATGSYVAENYGEGSGIAFTFTGSGKVYHLRGSIWKINNLTVRGVNDGLIVADRGAGQNALHKCSTDAVDDYSWGVRYDMGGDWGLFKADGTILLRRSGATGLTDAEGTAAPVAGTWARGSRVWNTTPSAGGPPGWVCVTGGTPGTWKAMANLAP